jgi:hypothetical protein
MESLNSWQLCDELSVFQAAVLLIGGDPSEVSPDIEDWNSQEKPSGYEAKVQAIISAIKAKVIIGELIPKKSYDIDTQRNEPIPNSTNIFESNLEVKSLKNWLISKGISTGFFFPSESEAPDYLNPDHPRYAPKLAATIYSWIAMEDSALFKTKSPKQALAKWLSENSLTYGGLTEEAIKECSKIANWQPSGGAVKTPSCQPPYPLTN